MLLAIDTATRTVSLALHDGSRLLAESTWETANNHTIELAPAIDGLLRRVGRAPSDVRAVAVALGPGSFTGLRIGIGLAKGMAGALGVPLIGVPTLEILASAQPYAAGHALIAVLQAGRGRLCAQRFGWQPDSGWTPQADPAILGWPALVDSLDRAAPVVISGEIDAEGMRLLETARADGLPLTVAPAALRLRRAGFLAEIAWGRLQSTDPPGALTPIYLHQPGVPHP